ncbi:TolB-like translocation protein [Rugamonas aquatica]|uniref:Uncharacterized protein n=1 Tax=Rugamonas aquatica TaxID=2743357 RepID=A0A6A7NBN3_9BURK|nr:PD40 domain-containing protein [Rugamonas aquatica]MQA42590.1 hypothetical protein [Rugamonas aquatica]
MELLHRRRNRSAWIYIAGASLGMLAGSAYAAPDISVRYVLLPPTEPAGNLTLSANGQYVSYRSNSPSVTNPAINIFIYDLVNNTRTQANLMPNGDLPAAATCDAPVMSADAHYVVFGCLASSMGTPVPSGGQSYYVYDRIRNKTEVIPATTSDTLNRQMNPAISADGHFIAYRSSNGSTSSLFVRNMVNKTTRTTTGQFLSAGSYNYINISTDGRFVSYDGRVKPESSYSDVWVHDVSKGTTEAINVTPAGLRGTKGANYPIMSADGNVVAFFSTDTALTSPPAPIVGGVFVRDRVAGKTEFVSGIAAAGFTNDHTLSANGRYVAFTGNPVQTSKNLYVYDRLTKVNRIIPGAIGGNRTVSAPRFSADGRYLVFLTSKSIAGQAPVRSIGIADLGVAAGLTVSADPLSLTEGGAAGTYSVVLAQVPNADVTVTISPDKQLSVARTKLVFTPDNWNVPQVVSVQALQDGVAEGKHNGVITHTVTSTDIDYTVVKPSSVTVAINDAVVPTVVLPGATWNQSELPVSGTAAPGANVLLTATNRSTGWLTSVSVLADAQGNWSRTLSGLSDGVIEIDAQADGIHSAVQSITVALLPPPPISLPPAQQ